MYEIINPQMIEYGAYDAILNIYNQCVIYWMSISILIEYCISFTIVQNNDTVLFNN